MSLRKDLKMLAEAYTGVESMPVAPSNMLGGKPVMITMDMPGTEIDHSGEDHTVDDSEIEMAAADLHKLAEYAPKLKEIISQMPELEGWVSAKITKAADYISSVYHWLEYQQHEGSQGGCSCGEESDMFNIGHEDGETCKYAQQGCKCHGCPDCH
jgi:L-fucose isomerase-like protein